MVWLVISGAVFEAAGFALAVAEVFELRRRVQKYRTRTQVVELGTAVEMEKSFGVGVLSGGEPPTLEERVAHLEGSMKGLNESIDDQFTKMRLRTDERVSGAVGAAERARQREDKALGDLVASDTRRVTVANFLFILGLILSTWGNLVGS